MENPIMSIEISSIFPNQTHVMADGDERDDD
jgi:hypothetical protein